MAGPAANTVAAIRLVRQLSGHRALNLLDRRCYPELVEMLPPLEDTAPYDFKHAYDG